MNNRRQMYYTRSQRMNAPQSSDCECPILSNTCGCNDSNEHHCECGDQRENNCGCIEIMPSARRHHDACYKEVCQPSSMNGFPIAMAYVPWQNFCDLYEEQEAFRTGTIFKNLNLEFYGRRCR